MTETLHEDRVRFGHGMIEASKPFAIQQDQNKTIFALASGVGRAAVALVRISGPSAGLTSRFLGFKLPKPRSAVVRRLFGRKGGVPLDHALVLWFPGPSSYTGEDCLELHLHGGPAVVRAVLAELGGLPQLRLARAGEFTERAFHNGKIDLSEIEGLADLIESDTESQRRYAMRQLDGELGRKVTEWSTILRDCRSLVEAELDFSDQDDVTEDCIAQVHAYLAPLSLSLAEALADSANVERLRNGFTVVISGPPNVGKSTLLNRIVRREAAIVSPFAGTTRDLIEISLEIDGVPIRLIDSAGIHESLDFAEAEGIRRALASAERANLVLWLSDGSVGSTTILSFPCEVLRIANKCDLQGHDISSDFCISAKTGDGVAELLAKIADLAKASVSGAEGALIANQRQIAETRGCRAAIDGILASDRNIPLELIAEDLRVATVCLERLIGKVGAEDILNDIFSRFCIGK